MSNKMYSDEYGFAGRMPLTSTQRMIPDGHFAPGLALGEMAPDFTLRDQHGEEVSFHADRSGARAAVLFYRSAVW